MAKTMVFGFAGLLLAGTLVSPAGMTTAAFGEETAALRPGNVQLLGLGTMEMVAGALFDEEKKMNPISGHATYTDGTTLDTKMQHDAWHYGGYGEFTLTENLGLQAGVEFRSIGQKVSVGGGSYEERIFGQGVLLEYVHPFAGVVYYLFNQDSLNWAAGIRVGKIMSGKIVPYVSTFDYLGESAPAYSLGGVTAGAGTQLAWVSEWFVMGAAFYVTENFFSTQEKIYPDLDTSFATFSYDLSLYAGVRF